MPIWLAALILLILLAALVFLGINLKKMENKTPFMILFVILLLLVAAAIVYLSLSFLFIFAI